MKSSAKKVELAPYTNLWAAVRGALGWGVFTAALCLVGALAGYWLAYAFKKEEEEK